MSGGSWDYVFGTVRDVATRLCASPSPERRALGVHLHDVARALHDVEWVDSGDYGEGADLAAIRTALGEMWPARVLAVLVQDAKNIQQELRDAIARVELALPSRDHHTDGATSEEK